MRIGLLAYPVNTRGGLLRWLSESVGLLRHEHEVFVKLGGMVELRGEDLAGATDVARLERISRLPVTGSGVDGVHAWVSQRSIDVVVSALPRANALALRLPDSVPIVVTLHGALPAGPRGLLYRSVFRWLRHRPVAVGVVSEDLRSEAGDLFPHSEIVTIPNAVMGGQAHSPDGSPPREGVIWVGRLVPEKGVALLAEVACRLDSPVEVLGSGSAANMLDTSAERGCVRLRGWVDDPSVSLAGAAVYLSTSPSEGMSYSFLDALSAGCVPVGSEATLGGLGLPDECIYVDADQLVERVNGLLALGPDGRERIAVACQQAVSRSHAPELLEQQWRELLSRAVGAS